MIKNILFLAVGAILSAALVLGVPAFATFDPFRVRQTDRSQPALLKSIQEISQYHAAVGNFEVVLDVEDNIAGVPTIIAGRRTLFVAAGTVDSYVDLSGLAEGDLKLSSDGNSVQVHLPGSELDKPNLDHDRSYVFTQDRGVLDRFADVVEVPQQGQFFKLAEVKLLDAAEKSELQNQAAENTKVMLTGVFNSLGIEATFQK